MNLYFSSSLSLNFSVPVLMLTVHLFNLCRLARASFTQTAGSPLCQRSCSTSGPAKSFCTSVSASCGTCEHHRDRQHPELLHLPQAPGPVWSFTSACKCSKLKCLFFCTWSWLLCQFFNLGKTKTTYVSTVSDIYRHTFTPLHFIAM